MHRALRTNASRLIVRAAGVATAAALAGCATTATSSSIAGNTLSVYVSLPPGKLSPESQDLLSAERLALQQAGGRAGRFQVRLVPFAGRRLSDNARQAIGDSNTIAYLGEIAPGASANTIGITNAEDVLQVSPTDTAVELTQKTSAVVGAPTRYYESLSTNGRTFARVVPTDALEAKALAGQMHALGVKQLIVKTDQSSYGRAMDRALITAAPPRAITTVSGGAGADALVYAGTSVSAAAQAFEQAVTANPKVLLFAPSALAQSSLVASLSPAAQRRLYVSEPGFTSRDLPAAGRQFMAAFRSAYGHPPATEAIFGYEAMSALLAVLREAAGSAGNRSAVVHDFFALRSRPSVLGTYSIDKNGDTSISPFVISRVKAGKLVPYRAAPAQG